MDQSLSNLPITGNGGTFTCSHDPPYTVGDKAYLSCQEGYKDPKIAFSTLTSENDTLIWNPAEIHCEPELTTLPKTEKGGQVSSLSSPPYRLGNKALLTCNFGYHLPTKTESTVVLKEGQLVWNPDKLNCIPVQCMPPFIPVYGDVTPKVYHFPQMITYFCFEGYRINKRLITTYCTANGRWMPDMKDVDCIPVSCPPLQAPLHGSVTAYTFTYGSVATFTCDQHYMMMEGDKRRTCQEDGTWSGSDVVCTRIPCPPLPPSVHIMPLNTKIMADTIFTVLCQDGSGVNIRCLPEGRWSLPYPYCKGPHLAPPSNKQPSVIPPIPSSKSNLEPHNYSVFTQIPTLFFILLIIIVGLGMVVLRIRNKSMKPKLT